MADEELDLNRVNWTPRLILRALRKIAEKNPDQFDWVDGEPQAKTPGQIVELPRGLAEAAARLTGMPFEIHNDDPTLPHPNAVPAVPPSDEQEDVWDVVVYPPDDHTVSITLQGGMPPQPGRWTGLCSCRGSWEMIPFSADHVYAKKVQALITHITRRPTARIGMYAVMPPPTAGPLEEHIL